MNDLIVDVKLWGESVGSLYWEKESNAALFDYERKFIRSGLDISPIIMPISQYRNTPTGSLKTVPTVSRGCPACLPIHCRTLSETRSSMNGLPARDCPEKRLPL
ncbi:HipA N-terminal domain-containing protein (plasmid) [Bacteroides xylanisolvens]|nr:HipA N-terminal domain-containing protein [Bacteroides xylanisolvens]